MSRKVRKPRSRAAQRSTATKIDPMRFVGVAVFAAQFFEMMFVLVARFALKHPNAQTIEEIAPLPSGAFKQAIAALVKELRAAEHISPEIADRIVAFVGDRNTLVHRVLFVSKVEQDQSDSELFEAMIRLSRRVYAEAMALSSSLIETLVDYSARFPETADSAKKLQAKLEGFSETAKALRTRVFG